LGINGIRLKTRAAGEDSRPVDPDSIYDYKSIGNSTTLPKDTTNQQELLYVLEKLSEKVSLRLKQKQMLATTIQLMIRNKKRKTITRSKKTENPINKTEDIFLIAKKLFLDHWDGNPIRLLGVTGQDLVEKSEAFQQLDIFSFEVEAKKEPLYNVLSQLQEKFGKDSISRGVHTTSQKPVSNNNEDTSFNKDFLRE
jgi:DNA polymerase IV